ncbi:NfeD family protein [Micromonospora sp. NPDC048999]|uniref:NfeD family protein n=1 Tax=Micromonospora sp. NPDC048999 TaxID=3155391 RepID=UPI0033E93A1F
MDAVLWIVLGVLLAVAEIFTTTLFLIMFAAGAFAAAGASALGAPIEVQALAFAVVSVLCVAVIRPIIRRHGRAAREGDERLFGVEALAGTSALVMEPVDVEEGLIKIDGELWTARAYDATRCYAVGERVQVMKVQGATALVWQEEISTPGGLPETKR